MYRRFKILFLYFVLCSNDVKAMGALSPLDPSSFARPEFAITKHMTLDLNVDFEHEVIRGKATLDIDILSNISELLLDVDGLNINSVCSSCECLSLQYKVNNHVPNFGSKLTILLPKPADKGESFKITIDYSTDPSASALTWIKAPYTPGKMHPFLYSQASPVHARSILPCQDTSYVKFTYDAKVTAPEGLTVLMGALRREEKNSTTTFNQPVPIPSSLFAIAVGVLESRDIAPNIKVWGDMENIDRYAYEFADTAKYLKAAEMLCGPYEWTEYGLLVLPPSFPHAAMENPCLTFVSPTIVAGDRSLTSTIVHELVHSWTGNLVSIKNYEHFWIKEGITVYLERKISASFITDTDEAKTKRDFHSLLGLQQLSEGINVLGASNPLTKLRLNLEGVHPDDSFSIVPYEKGSLFMRYLEDLFGGPKIFDDYIRSFVREFRMHSIDTEQFKSHFVTYFKNSDKLETVDWDSWLYSPGMPPFVPDYDKTMALQVKALVPEIEKPGFTPSFKDIENFDVHQLIYLLQLLIEGHPLSLELLTSLGSEYEIANSANNEIIYRWLRLHIKSRNNSKLDHIFNFLNSSGRLKYVRPLYRDLYAWEAVRQLAIDNFLKHEKFMSHLTAYNLKKDLHLT